MENNIGLDVNLHHKQGVALQTEGTEILYGGAAGGGKSHLMRYASVLFCLAIPGIQIYLFRRKYNDLTQNHLFGPSGYAVIMQPFAETKQAKINYSDNRIDFANGSRIFLRHCQHEKDVYNYQGAEIHLLMIDELTHFSKKIYTFLRSRTRLGGFKIDYDSVSKKLPFVKKGFFPRILCGTNPGGVGHCVPYGDVLTESGWVPIQNVNIGDRVFTVDSNCNMVLGEVSDVVSYMVDTKLKHVHTKTFDMVCTDKHKVPYYPDSKITGGKFSLKEFDNLPNEVSLVRSVNWVGSDYAFFCLSKNQELRERKLNQPLKVSYTDYAELMGWYLSEGSYLYMHDEKRFMISQRKCHYRDEIRYLLNRMGFQYKEYVDEFIIYSAEWAEYFSQFGGSVKKFIPYDLKNSSDINVLLKALMGGDGHWVTNNSGHYYTISEKLADDVQEIALKLGYIVRCSSRLRKNRKHISYDISLRKNATGCSVFNTGNSVYKNRISTRNHTENVDYNGNVYCITVPDTHTFILRQNGHISVTGNSWVKQSWVDAAPPMKIWTPPATEGKMHRVFIPATLVDNPTMSENDPDYEDRLRGLSDPALAEAMLSGNWDIISGGAVDDVWKREVHVIPAFDIPKDWMVDRTFDWGSAKPFAVCYWAESNGNPVTLPNGKELHTPPGTVFLIDEIYGWNGTANEGCKMSARKVGDAIRKFEETRPYRKQIVPGAADSAIWANLASREDHESILDNIMYGYNVGVDKVDGNGNPIPMLHTDGYVNTLFERADKSPGSRVKGLELVRSYLQASLDVPMEEKGMFIFDKCIHFIRTVPILPRSESNPEDVDTEAEDHIFDCVRYRLLTKVDHFQQLEVLGI